MMWLDKGTTEDDVVWGITYSMDMSLSKLWERVEDREAWRAATVGSKRVRHDLVTEQQQRNDSQ